MSAHIASKCSNTRLSSPSFAVVGVASEIMLKGPLHWSCVTLHNGSAHTSRCTQHCIATCTTPHSNLPNTSRARPTGDQRRAIMMTTRAHESAAATLTVRYALTNTPRLGASTPAGTVGQYNTCMRCGVQMSALRAVYWPMSAAARVFSSYRLPTDVFHLHVVVSKSRRHYYVIRFFGMPAWMIILMDLR